MIHARYCRRLLGLALVAALSLQTAVAAEPLTLEIKRARAGSDQRTGQPILTITLTDASKEAFGRFTSANIARNAEMRIDGETMMAPVIREPIMGGSFQISGADLTADKLRALAERLCQDERCVRVQVEIVPD